MGTFRPSSSLSADVSNLTVGFSANLYTLSSRGRLSLIPNTDYNALHPTYIATIPRPERDSHGLFFAREVHSVLDC